MITRSQVKLINSLKYKKNRDKYDLFMVEGHKIVIELLDSDYEIYNIFATEQWVLNNNIKIKNIHVVKLIDLKKISNLDSTPNVIAIVRKNLRVADLSLSSVNVALFDIQDPGNLGTIIRTCDWFGVRNIICSNNTVDKYNPKVIQSSMGSIFRVNVIYLNLFEYLKNLSEDVLVYCTTVSGGEIIEDIKDSSRKLIVFGNESRGLPDEMLNMKILNLSIEKKGSAESLNVATACGIILNNFCN
ncbi:MAG: RNA methyltransferase [Flavobacteriales bacterium]|nr:RNA methyltransferase [Flavobacteriales bacterium]|tara:strand:+ start:109 stop:840 length:732 start_codon:yes stop_codon:yes gene_type:complete